MYFITPYLIFFLQMFIRWIVRTCRHDLWQSWETSKSSKVNHSTCRKSSGRRHSCGFCSEVILPNLKIRSIHTLRFWIHIIKLLFSKRVPISILISNVHKCSSYCTVDHITDFKALPIWWARGWALTL